MRLVAYKPCCRNKSLHQICRLLVGVHSSDESPPLPLVPSCCAGARNAAVNRQTRKGSGHCRLDRGAGRLIYGSRAVLSDRGNMDTGANVDGWGHPDGRYRVLRA